MSKQHRGTNAELRLGVPDLFATAKFEQVLILTYTLDPDFYERVLRRHFGSYRNQIVLADAHKLTDAVESVRAAATLRHLNRSWLAAPLGSQHAAHAKAILLAGPEHGLLLVGSGNLNLSGYARNGECFTPYRWSHDHPDDLNAFTAVRDLTDKLAARESLDKVTIDRIRKFWHAYDWWNDQPIADGVVRHNLDRPLGEQLVDVIDGEPVDRLTVIAPFHDPKCAALARLADRCAAAQIRVYVQPGACSVDPVALHATLQKYEGTVHSIVATGDPDAYLHAKIIRVQTPTRDICLTGSANCSIVALWANQPTANIEIGNLAIGAAGTFDDLFDPGVVTVSEPVDPTTLGIALDQVDDPDNERDEPPFQLRELVWNRPRISGELSALVDDSAIVTVLLDGQPIVGEIELLTPVNGWTPFSVTVKGDDEDRIDGVAVVTVEVDGIGEASAVPYQVARLREQDHRRVDVERLRKAAEIEVDDPELNELLAALEGILIGDNVATWSREKATQHQSEDGDGEHISWDRIDWDAVRRGHRHSAYGGVGGFVVEGSDLAAYLDALARATRELIEPAPSDQPSTPNESEDDDDDEGDVPSGVEGAESDEDDEDEDDVDPAGPSRSITLRNRRRLRNLIRRNLVALEQPSFREGAGPAIVILNMIILNHLCWWFSTSDPDDPSALLDERLRLWTVMWGDGETPGYFVTVPTEYETDALDVFDRQNFEPVLLASIANAWEWLEEGSAPHRALRRVLHDAVTQPWWQAGPEQVIHAAALTNRRPTTIKKVSSGHAADVLWDLICEPIGDEDTKLALATTAGIDASAVTLSDQTVMVTETNRTSVPEARLTGVPVSAELAKRLFAVWQGVDERRYYRLAWDEGVALYRAQDGSGWIFDGTADDPEEFGVIEPRWSPAGEWAWQLAEAVVAKIEDAA